MRNLSEFSKIPKLQNTQIPACSLIHSTISGLWALCLLLNHPEMLRGTNVITYSSWWSHQLPLMSIGYFIYDWYGSP